MHFNSVKIVGYWLVCGFMSTCIVVTRISPSSMTSSVKVNFY